MPLNSKVYTFFADKASVLPQVVASNPMGQVSEFFTIATDAAPQITRGLDPEIEKRFTYDIALEVRGTGSPKPMAKW